MAEPIAVSSSSPDRSSKPKEKPNDWLHIAFVRVFALLVSHVGTEIALGKGKTPSRCLIVSAINRTIHFPTSKGYDDERSHKGKIHDGAPIAEKLSGNELGGSGNGGINRAVG
jgi:hypothetical protein